MLKFTEMCVCMSCMSLSRFVSLFFVIFIVFGIMVVAYSPIWCLFPAWQCIASISMAASHCLDFFSLLARFLKSETLQQHLRQFRGTRYQIKWKSLKKHTHTNGKEKILYFIDGWSSNFNTQNAYHRWLKNLRIM